MAKILGLENKWEKKFFFLPISATTTKTTTKQAEKQIFQQEQPQTTRADNLVQTLPEPEKVLEKQAKSQSKPNASTPNTASPKVASQPATASASKPSQSEDETDHKSEDKTDSEEGKFLVPIFGNKPLFVLSMSRLSN